ncbi:MAG: glutamate mutase L [Anaerolineales bacterium]|nr:glutamate mutase L [Anaerolineales bacterium]
MPASLVEGASLLAIDVGTASTRAVLFDIVEGSYRFVASGQAPSTAEAPFQDIGSGVKDAIKNLEEVTGHTLLDGGNVIIPTQPDGSGIDTVAAIISAGPVLKTAVVGLLSDVSLYSALRLASTTYTRVVETIGLNDPRLPEEIIDNLIRIKPDLVVIAGGTDGGATRSVQKLLEIVGLSCYLLTNDNRPAILFAGNQEMKKEVSELLGNLSSLLQFGPNIRPSLENEDLGPASRQLAQLQIGILKNQLRGTEELEVWAGGHILPSAYAQGRMIRFLSRAFGAAKGLLGVDIGASATTIAAGFNGDLSLNVYPQFGLGEYLPEILKYTTIEEITQWLPIEIPARLVHDSIYERSLYPTTVPTTKEDQAVTQAIARQALRLAIQAAKQYFPPEAKILREDLLPLFEPIIAGGGILSDARPGQSLLMLLDALQPVGVTTITLDQNRLLPILGVAGEKNTLLPIQVLESGAFLNTGTVISVISSTSFGTPVLRATLIYNDGNEVNTEIKFGNLEIMPLKQGLTAKLKLQPLRRADVGLGPGRGGIIPVGGGALGVIIDARGRPIQLPEDPGRRRELIKKWTWTVGG